MSAEAPCKRRSAWTSSPASLFVLVISLSAPATFTTQIDWAPSDVDAEKIELDPTASCHLEEVTRSASQRVAELARNLDRYTATENIEHFEVRSTGVKGSREIRKFNYLVEIHQIGASDLDVEEHRTGWMPTEKIRGYPPSVQNSPTTSPRSDSPCWRRFFIRAYRQGTNLHAKDLVPGKDDEPG